MTYSFPSHQIFLDGVTPDHSVWLIGGPFSVQTWYTVRHQTEDMRCTQAQLDTALDGSFMLDLFYGDGSGPLSTKYSSEIIGALTSAQLRDRLQYYAEQLQLDDTEPIASTYANYDMTWALVDALYRVGQTMAASSNVTLANALASGYESFEYKRFSQVYIQELAKTRFYGATVSAIQ